MMAVMFTIIIVTTTAAATTTTTAAVPVLLPTSNKPSNLPGKQCSAVYLPSSVPGVIGAGNIAHKMGATLGECCSACQAEHACVAFDWRHVDRDPENQINCWLKDNLQRTPEKPGLRTSAVLCRAAGPNCSLPVGPPPPPPLPPPPPPSIANNISLSSANLGLRFDGIGGLAAIGGARLLYEYPVAVRSHILDLLFSPTGGGALYHILKIEIEGDSDSSYGSGSSFQHTASPDSMSFARGIYLPWLIQEAKRRQPEIKLYCLSWGLPHWVGRTNGSTSGVLSSQGVAYHRDYLLGAKRVHNISFDYVGVWNESPYSRDYIKELRRTLDDNGMANTQIVVPDGSPSAICTDCPPEWGHSIVDHLKNDAALAQAVGVIGIHGHDVEGIADVGDWQSVQNANIALWNSEQNLIDGPMPQWSPTKQDKYGSGLAWPRVFIANYVRRRATATILCPITHSFTWNYGRQNHGHSQFVQPWGHGYYELGSAFWSQAQFSQFVKPGWRFLGGTGTGEICNDSESSLQCNTLWAALTDYPNQNLTVVIVHTGTSPIRWHAQLGGDFVALGGTQLSRWETVEAHYLKKIESLLVLPGGVINLTLPSRSVTTLTTLLSAGRHCEIPSLRREQFPMPWLTTFEGQRVGAPGRLLSDVFGAFEVALCDSSSGDTGQCLRQAVSTAPGKNAWSHFGESLPRQPFTTLPAGVNWQNVVVAVKARLLTTDNAAKNDTMILCGRVPVIPPGKGFCTSGPTIASPGVCLALQRDGLWRLSEAGSSESCSVLTSGKVGAASSQWQLLELQFSSYAVSVLINGIVVLEHFPVRLASGVVGLGSSWAEALYDNLTLGIHPRHYTAPGSFIYDVLVGAKPAAQASGWAGMAIEVKSAILVSALGRFRTANNSGIHRMAIFRANDNSSVIADFPSVNMSCTEDLLGFCYTPPLAQPVRLPPGRYYVVSEEHEAGDALTVMDDSARMTTHAHRDGLTYVSYAGPDMVEIAGRVMSGGASHQWSVTAEMDTAFGPLNMLLQQV